MDKCPKCDEKLSPTAKRCPNCGYILSNDNKNTSEDKISQNKIIVIAAIVVIIIIVGVLASGMFSNNSSTDDSSVKQNEDNVKSVNNDNSVSSDEPSEYWASANADKFHLPDCEWAEKISENNKIIYDSREDAIADGKEPCGVCNP